jgi:hypothetical protein
MPNARSASKQTTNHDTIRRWVEARGGCPARVKGTGRRNDPGLLRIDYPGYRGVSSLEPISWREFFKGLDENDLVFVYQEKTASGRPSRFSKLVSRDTAETRRSANGRSSNGARRKTSNGSSRSTPRARKSRSSTRSSRTAA